jgi:hypothetical protein
MAKYLVGGDRYADELVEASSIVEAVREYSDTADGSDRFDVYARAESDDHWTVFPVTTRTELIITVGNGKRGPMVDDDDSEARMTTPHTPPAALLDVAAIEARAAAATCPRCHGRGTVYDSTPAGYLVERQCVACLGAGRPSSDVLALLAALRTLAAQHAADVAAAVDAAARSTREACAAQLRARAECLRRYAYEATAKADAAEYAHDAREVDACAAIVASVALAAPTGGRE